MDSTGSDLTQRHEHLPEPLSGPHNVVSWDVSRGVPLEIAGKNVGHRSRQATEIYAHFAPDARARAMRVAVEQAGKS